MVAFHLSAVVPCFRRGRHTVRRPAGRHGLLV